MPPGSPPDYSKTPLLDLLKIIKNVGGPTQIASVSKVTDNWQQVAAQLNNYLGEPLSTDPNTLTGQVTLLMQKMQGWKGAGAQEFADQFAKLSSYGMDVGARAQTTGAGAAMDYGNFTTFHNATSDAAFALNYVHQNGQNIKPMTFDQAADGWNQAQIKIGGPYAYRNLEKWKYQHPDLYRQQVNLYLNGTNGNGVGGALQQQAAQLVQYLADAYVGAAQTLPAKAPGTPPGLGDTSPQVQPTSPTPGLPSFTPTQLAGLSGGGPGLTGLPAGGNPNAFHTGNPNFTPGGFNPKGLTANGVNPNGLTSGFNPHGLSPNGLNSSGLNSSGFNPHGLNPTGLNPNGLNASFNPGGVGPNALHSGLNPNTFSPAALTNPAFNPHTKLADFNPGALGPGGPLGPGGGLSNGLTPFTANGLTPFTASGLTPFTANGGLPGIGPGGLPGGLTGLTNAGAGLPAGFAAGLPGGGGIGTGTSLPGGVGVNGMPTGAAGQALTGQAASEQAAAANRAGLAGEAAAAGAGAGGGAGGMPFMPFMPMGGQGGGQGNNGGDRRTWLEEDSDVWGADTNTLPPPVIGRRS